MLDFKQIETDLIPYWQYIEFHALPTQEFYFLPYVAAIEESTFNIGPVRYPMVSTSRSDYFGSSRVDNIYTLPFSWNYERGVGGGTMGMYFIPDQPYPIKMKAKIFLVDVDLQTDLTNIPALFQPGCTPNCAKNPCQPGCQPNPCAPCGCPGCNCNSPQVYDGCIEQCQYDPNCPFDHAWNIQNSGNNCYTPYRFINNSNQGYDTSYIEYLRYSLAKYMASEYGIEFNPQSERILMSYQRKLMYEGPPDLSGKKLSILYADSNPGYNWGDVNIGHGFRP